MSTSPSQEDFDRQVRLQVYQRFVAEGRAPAAEEVARVLGLAREQVNEAFRRLAAGRILVLRPGTTEILMANPLSAVPTPFRVETPRGAFYGNCIWDALGVIAMLGRDGRILTSCGDCGDPMMTTVQDGAPLESQGVIHFAVPAARWWDDIVFT